MELSFLFGTPEPVKYIERFETEDVELDCTGRANGKVVVSDYDRSVYKDDEEVKLAVKQKMPGFIEQGLEKYGQKGSIIRRRSAMFCTLSEVAVELLKEMGISADVVISNFTISEESEKEAKEILKVLLTQNVDRTDRPCPPNLIDLMKNNPDLKPDCGGWNPSTGQGFMEMYLAKHMTTVQAEYDKFCRECGTKREGNAVFCPQCGRKFEK
jgi:membrane protease subunit (stomatin/prohibitin family)